MPAPTAASGAFSPPVAAFVVPVPPGNDSDEESEEESLSELWLDDFCLGRSLRSVEGILTGRNRDLTDQSETARSSKLRVVSGQSMVLLLVILEAVVLVVTVGIGPAHKKNRSVGLRSLSRRAVRVGVCRWGIMSWARCTRGTLPYL